MWYDLDIYKFGEHLLPPVLRKKRLFAFLCVLLLPAKMVMQVFRPYRKDCLDKLMVNGRIIYIEKILNDRFYLKNKEIYIDDFTEAPPWLYSRLERGYPSISIFKRAEGGILDKIYIKKRAEGKLGGDFIIWVPGFLDKQSYMAEIKNIADYYRPAGRNYTIKIYDYE